MLTGQVVRLGAAGWVKIELRQLYVRGYTWSG